MMLGVLRFFLFVFLFTSQPSKSEPIEGYLVKLQILDKITAEVFTFDIMIDQDLKFGSLIIEIYACYKNPPEEIPENFVLLKIFDKINDINLKKIYQGWMISSSPASTPLEHPIYDLWLKDCKIKKDF